MLVCARKGTTRRPGKRLGGGFVTGKVRSLATIVPLLPRRGGSPCAFAGATGEFRARRGMANRSCSSWGTCPETVAPSTATVSRRIPGCSHGARRMELLRTGMRCTDDRVQDSEATWRQEIVNRQAALESTAGQSNPTDSGFELRPWALESPSRARDETGFESSPHYLNEGKSTGRRAHFRCERCTTGSRSHGPDAGRLTLPRLSPLED